MVLKSSPGSEPRESDTEPGPWSGGGFHSSSQCLQQGQDAEAQHPTLREQEQEKCDPCNSDHPGQGHHSPELGEPHALTPEPRLFAVNAAQRKQCQ